METDLTVQMAAHYAKVGQNLLKKARKNLKTRSLLKSREAKIKKVCGNRIMYWINYDQKDSLLDKWLSSFTWEAYDDIIEN